MTSYLQQPKLHTKAPYRAAVLTYPNNLKQALKDAVNDPSKVMFAVGQGIASVHLTKIYASTKPDIIWLDVEHGIFDRHTLYDCIQAAQHHSEGVTSVVVRVPKNDETSLTTALDAGAAGIIIPHVESADEVRHYMKEIYYPPLGHRSFSPWVFAPGISDGSLYEDDAFNLHTSNRHVAFIPQIESVKGVENLDEIAAVPGVDAMLFGMGDFSFDAGVGLRSGAPPTKELVSALAKFSEIGKKYGIPLLGNAMDPSMIPGMIDGGYRAFMTIMDVWAIASLAKGKADEQRLIVQEYAKQKSDDTAGVEDKEVANKEKA